MGDDDAYDLEKCTRSQAEKMAWLIGMKATIDSDDSGHYEVPLTLDESLREKHPAVKDAYEQYQVLLKFAKADHYAQEENDNNT